jgi:hypothetical protein
MDILTAFARFDPAFTRKIARTAAAVCLVEFLLAIALLKLWVPGDSKCLSWRTPDSIYMFLLPLAGLVLWICILAVAWNRIARLISAQLQREDPQHRLTGLLFFYPVPISNALVTVIFLVFAAAAAIPVVIIIRDCGP